MPYASPQNVQPKGAGKWGAGGHNYPPQGDFNALFCVLIAPPFDPLLMNTLGAYHNRFVIRWVSEGGFGRPSSVLHRRETIYSRVEDNKLGCGRRTGGGKPGVTGGI